MKSLEQVAIERGILLKGVDNISYTNYCIKHEFDNCTVIEDDEEFMFIYDIDMYTHVVATFPR